MQYACCLNGDQDRSSLQPRTYPPRFGQRVSALYERFCTKREAYPPEWDSDTMNILKAKEVFAMVSWESDDLWEDAGLKDVFCYLRGSKSLVLGDWRPYFPTTI